jgi:hypothetical protein
MARNRPDPGPYSRQLRRGAIARLADGRSTPGRYIRHLEAKLTAHLGGHPSVAEKLLIEAPDGDGPRGDGRPVDLPALVPRRRNPGSISRIALSAVRAAAAGRRFRGQALAGA